MSRTLRIWGVAFLEMAHTRAERPRLPRSIELEEKRFSIALPTTSRHEITVRQWKWYLPRHQRILDRLSNAQALAANKREMHFTFIFHFHHTFSIGHIVDGEQC